MTRANLHLTLGLSALAVGVFSLYKQGFLPGLSGIVNDAAMSRGYINQGPMIRANQLWSNINANNYAMVRAMGMGNVGATVIKIGPGRGSF